MTKRSITKSRRFAIEIDLTDFKREFKTEVIDEVGEMFREFMGVMERNFDDMRDRFDRLENSITVHDARLNNHELRLGGLEEKAV